MDDTELDAIKSPKIFDNADEDEALSLIENLLDLCGECLLDWRQLEERTLLNRARTFVGRDLDLRGEDD